MASIQGSLSVTSFDRPVIKTPISSQVVLIDFDDGRGDFLGTPSLIITGNAEQRQKLLDAMAEAHRVHSGIADAEQPVCDTCGTQIAARSDYVLEFGRRWHVGDCYTSRVLAS